MLLRCEFCSSRQLNYQRTFILLSLLFICFVKDRYPFSALYFILRHGSYSGCVKYCHFGILTECLKSERLFTVTELKLLNSPASDSTISTQLPGLLQPLFFIPYGFSGQPRCSLPQPRQRETRETALKFSAILTPTLVCFPSFLYLIHKF